MSKTRENPMVEWRHINWRKLEKRVFKLQKRIYRAEQRGDTKAVRRLQKTLMRSWSAKCLAVRRVTQDNQGRKTAGVDGIKSLSPVQRLELVKSLKLSHKAKPTRRVWIPKPGTEEKRPLGIPTMADRSPYDGDFIYWSTRMGKHPEISTRVATLLKRQKGRCAHCELFFKDGDLIETDHKNPKSQGGRDSYDNLQLLHRHCHDVKTANDDKAGGMCNQRQKTLRSRVQRNPQARF